MFLLVKRQHFNILKIIWTKEFFVGVLYVGSSVICFISYVITSKLFTYQEFNHIFQEYSINFQGDDTVTTNNLGLKFFFCISLLVLCYLITFPLLLVVWSRGLRTRHKLPSSAHLPLRLLECFLIHYLHHTALPLLEKTLSCFPEFQMRLRQSSSVETLETNYFSFTKKRTL